MLRKFYRFLRKHLKRPAIGLALVILVFHIRFASRTTWADIALAPSDPTFGVDTTLPHTEFRRITDSLDKQFSRSQDNLRTPGSGMSFLGLGIYQVNDQYPLPGGERAQGPDLYFLGLSDYYTQPDVTFSWENGRVYQHFPNYVDTGGFHRERRIAKKELSVRFIPPALPGDRGMLLVPITAGWADFLRITQYIVVPAVLVFLLVLILKTFRILYRMVAKLPIEKPDLKAVKHLGWTMLFLGVAHILVSFIMEGTLALPGRLPWGTGVPTLELIFENKIWLSGGILLLALQSGLKLRRYMDQEAKINV